MFIALFFIYCFLHSYTILFIRFVFPWSLIKPRFKKLLRVELGGRFEYHIAMKTVITVHTHVYA